MEKECKICKKMFEPFHMNTICCSIECRKINKAQYELSPKRIAWVKQYDSSSKRKEAHRLWRQSERGKAWAKEYSKSPHAKALQKIRDKTDKYKAFRRKNDWTPKRILARKLYRQSPRGREAFRMMCRRREARLNNVIHAFKTEEWISKLQQTNGFCPCCKEYIGIDKLTLDHIFPLSKASDEFQISGVKRIYTIKDIQPLCRRCNRLKSDKYIITYDIIPESMQEKNISWP